MTSRVNFVCQKCAQPLKIDTSFDRNLDKEEYKKLTGNSISFNMDVD